ncbi:MAG: primosomal protein N', partial [Planctomycetota bacterium]|nr:primosomal protein N' [Planctomycetota bacterium]
MAVDLLNPVAPDSGTSGGESGGPFAEVAVEAPVSATFAYRVPESLAGLLVPGLRVRVPFGGRTVIGYFLGPMSRERIARDGVPEDKIKPIIDAVEKRPAIVPEMLALARWMSSYYRCGLGEALSAVVPAPVKWGARIQKIRVVRSSREPAGTLERARHIEKRAAKRAAILRELAAIGEPVIAGELLKAAGADRSSLDALIRSGDVVARDDDAELPAGDIEAAAAGERRSAAGDVELTAEQRAALDIINRSIDERRFQVHLLQGVTGSGKTEVYIRALERTVAAGRKGIVLVPEIALTPQTAGRFSARFPRIAILHSHLTPGQRARQWERIREGGVDVVVGARSAIFAPLSPLGLLVIDEEHEGSFKQQNVPRYHARDVGIVRARESGATVILGSATPSLESWRNAVSGKYTHLTLGERVGGRPMPDVHVVDMTQENRDTGRFNVFSRALREAMVECFESRGQAILFLNRRGYSTVITCPRCGTTVRCSQCDIAMTYHRSTDRLRCHYCDRTGEPPKECPACLCPHIKYWGIGTERVEEEARKTLPEARIARMDSDTMSRRRAYAEILAAFRARELDVLVGTQMIAKGLDFPDVTLVGIVLADTALHLPDFRSRERTFQLLAQVAGRSGRGERGGKVIVQTFMPADPAIRAARDHDFEGFARQELASRRDFGYPPFSRLARIVLRGKVADKIVEAARGIAE